MPQTHVRRLIVAATCAIALAASAASVHAFPLHFGKGGCKEDKERLKREERILKDRQQLAYHQCQASPRGAQGRCEDLKRQQKAELDQWKDRHKVASGDCKQGDKADNREAKGEKKADKHQDKTDRKAKTPPRG